MRRSPGQTGRRGRGLAPVEVVELGREERGAAAGTLTDAFLDDPVWVAIGPELGAARRRVARMWFMHLDGP